MENYQFVLATRDCRRGQTCAYRWRRWQWRMPACWTLPASQAAVPRGYLPPAGLAKASLSSRHCAMSIHVNDTCNFCIASSVDSYCSVRYILQLIDTNIHFSVHGVYCKPGNNYIRVQYSTVDFLHHPPSKPVRFSWLKRLTTVSSSSGS